MDILIATDSYYPEIRTISFMVKELAEELAACGHNVIVVTSWPRYNLNEDTKQKTFTEYSEENNVKVIRIKSPPHHKINFVIRGVVELILPLIFYKKIMKYHKQKFDSTIIISPPLPLSLLGIIFKNKFRSKFLLYFTDIFPQSAIDLGAMRNSLIINFFEWLEGKSYRNADIIISSTKHSREFLIEKKWIPKDKITTISNWIDFDSFKDAKPKGEFRNKYGLLNKFVFLFAGILSLPQNLEFVIQVARRLIDQPEICFLFVGEGTDKKRLQQSVKNHRLQNVVFAPFVSKEEYPYLIKEMDVGLVCLGSKNKTPVIPGKILGFMASAIPVVAFLNKESDAHAIIKEANCGYVCLSGDLEQAEKIVRIIFSEKNNLSTYGQNGYEYAVKYFSKSVCIEKFKQLI